MKDKFKFEVITVTKRSERKHRKKIIAFLKEFTINLNRPLNLIQMDHYFMGNCSKN